MTVEQLPFAGCPWPIDTTCIGTDEWEAFDVGVRELAVSLASSTLHALSARRVGGCPITLRPARQGAPCVPAYDARWMVPSLVAGYWVNYACGGENPTCSIELPAPVGRVDSVKVDGVELDLSDFRIDNGSLLVYQGADECPFPADQDLRLPDTEPGTFSITYLNAYEPDRFAAQAVAHLAVQFAVACTEGPTSRRCRLPKSVTTLVRTGVTMELARGAFPDGFTGIDEVDTWLSVVNPKGRRSVTKIWSPDDDQHIQGRTLGAAPSSGSGGLLP